jgi:hypothetical protein
MYSWKIAELVLNNNHSLTHSFGELLLSFRKPVYHKLTFFYYPQIEVIKLLKKIYIGHYLLIIKCQFPLPSFKYNSMLAYEW